MTARGYSAQVIGHALKRWPRGHSDDSYWRHWKAWCERGGISPLKGDPMTVAECLAEYEATRGFKFIEKLKCAVSTFMELLYGQDASERISNHPVIKSQLTGSKKTKPSKPRYGKDDAWDVGLIPKYWSGQAENAELSVQELGYKVTSLWLAVGSARISCVSHICRDTMTFPLDAAGAVSGLRFQYWFTKESGGPVRTDYLFIPSYPDKKLCLVEAVRQYLDKTSDASVYDHKPRMQPRYRNYDISGAPPLLLMTCTVGRVKYPVHPERISKWMKMIMGRAGVPSKYTAGSARMASASKLLDSGQSLEYVLGLGRWSSYQIFNRHYNRSRLAHQGISGIMV